MNRNVIGIMAAMPEEIRPLLAVVGAYRTERIGSYLFYRFSCCDREIYLLQSGMGPQNAAAGTHALIAAADPALIINFGFAGAVADGPQVGDIIVANRLLFHRERLFSEQQGVLTAEAERVSLILAKSLLGSCRVFQGAFITTGHLLTKRQLAQRLPAGIMNPALEMESSAVAKVAVRENVAFLGIRGVSDPASEELGFRIDEFANRHMRIRWWKVLWVVIRRPWIIPQLLRLRSNIRYAGVRLGLAIIEVLKKY